MMTPVLFLHQLLEQGHLWAFKWKIQYKFWGDLKCNYEILFRSFGPAASSSFTILLEQ